MTRPRGVGRHGLRPVSAMLAVVIASATSGAVASARVPTTDAAVTRATADPCASFAAMRDAFDGIGELPTTAKAFAAIDKATRAFRKAAARAPDEIADDMGTLAASLDQLARKLRPLRAGLHHTRDAEKYAAMVAPIERAFEQWAEAQDTQALGDAQARVQEWASATCNIELGTGTAPPDATPDATPASG